MNNNKNNYKKAVEQIHASKELKEKTIKRIEEKNMIKSIYLKVLSSVAVFVLVFSVGIFEFNRIRQEENKDTSIKYRKEIAKIEIDLPKFKDIDELREIIKEDNSYGLYRKRSMISEDVMMDTMSNTKESAKQENEENDYSTTNIQVENVDEADIVKTDGNYIYYVTANQIFIIDANKMEIINDMNFEGENDVFYPREIFINKNKMVVLGNYNEYEKVVENDDFKESNIAYSYGRVTTKTLARAIVCDISNKEDVKILREVDLDGYYINARMIEDNIYFISRKAVYYYDEMKDDEILPHMKDSLGEEKIINCTDIIYFRNSDSRGYMLVGGFNINNTEAVNVETFWGASEEIYASEKNLYITQNDYSKTGFYRDLNTIIYKFKLDNSSISLVAKGEVEGYINNQFSMDEYEGNLRIATTYSVYNGPEIEETEEKHTTNINDFTEANRLYILDENLKEIGKIDNLAKDERIYAVRFIGKIGYIVTFKEVDPLFVIDLSNPKDPQIKGELKIPGYSSYLHPYDENHIIGIGYNTESNGHGGVRNTNLKMSMFDVSDLENPKELFNIDIGENYSYSEILYNHKALFYKKSDNLIGFPVNGRFELFKINLENGFEKYGKIEEEKYYNISRAIYIENILYTLGYDKISSYKLENLEKIKDLELKIKGVGPTIREIEMNSIDTTEVE